MNADFEDEHLTISIVDIKDDNTLNYHDDLHDDLGLRSFLADTSYDGVQCRLYLAEQKGTLASSVIEAFGAALKLDPRWFQWHIKGSKNVMSSGQRHRAPFTALTFRLVDPDGELPTDTESFRVSLYVQPHENGKSWTGMEVELPVVLKDAKVANICLTFSCRLIQFASSNYYLSQCTHGSSDFWYVLHRFPPLTSDKAQDVSTAVLGYASFIGTPRGCGLTFLRI
jgi:hypothetical protein